MQVKQVKVQVHEDGFWCKLEFVDNFGFGEEGGLLEGSVMEYVVEMRMLEARVDMVSGIERGDSLGSGLSLSSAQGEMVLWGEVGGCKGGGVVPRAPHLKQDQDCSMRKFTRLITGLLDRNICILMIKAQTDCACRLILFIKCIVTSIVHVAMFQSFSRWLQMYSSFSVRGFPWLQHFEKRWQ